jgi:hypothetical protein
MIESIDLAEKSAYKSEGIVEISDLCFENVTLNESSFFTGYFMKLYNKNISMISFKNVKFINCSVNDGFLYIGDRVSLENVEFINLKCDELNSHCLNSFKNCVFTGENLKLLKIDYLSGAEKIKYGNSSLIDLDISKHLGEVNIFNLELDRVVTNPELQFKLRYQDFEDFDFKKFGIKRRGEIGYCIRSLQKGRIETLIASSPKKNDDFYEQFQSEYPVLKDLGIIS